MDNNALLLESEDGIGVSVSPDIAGQKKLQLSLYNKLSEPSENFSFEEWIDEFAIFSDKYDRFLYSIVSSSIIKEKEDSKVSFVVNNIKTVLERVRQKISSGEANPGIREMPPEKYKMIVKLYDHCNLAYIQREAYSQTKEEINRLTEDSIKERVSGYEKDITAQLISLVSIFTALSFVIFGGISVLDNLLQNVRALPLIKVAFIADVWFGCMANILVVFMKFICVLTGREKYHKWWPAFLTVNLVCAALLVFLILAVIFYFSKQSFLLESVFF